MDNMNLKNLNQHPDDKNIQQFYILIKVLNY